MILSCSDSTFSRDVLSIEILGLNRPQLTIVDFPGLTHSETRQKPRHRSRLRPMFCVYFKPENYHTGSCDVKRRLRQPDHLETKALGRSLIPSPLGLKFCRVGKERIYTFQFGLKQHFQSRNSEGLP